MDIKSIVEKNNCRAGKFFDISIQSLIIISIITFSIETLPNLDPRIRNGLQITEWIIVIFFTIEYILRIWVADKKWGYIFSFYGIIDFLAIFPFYLSSGLDLRSLRIFRLLRIFHLFKLFRYNKAIQRLIQAFTLIKEELLLFGIITLMILYLSAVGIYYFEQQAQPEAFGSVFHSLWWAVTTLTTVGYGELYPITIGGKLFTFIVLMVGLGIVAIPTGLIASALSQIRQENEHDQSLSKKVHRPSNH